MTAGGGDDQRRRRRDDLVETPTGVSGVDASTTDVARGSAIRAHATVSHAAGAHETVAVVRGWDCKQEGGTAGVRIATAKSAADGNRNATPKAAANGDGNDDRGDTVCVAGQHN